MIFGNAIGPKGSSDHGAKPGTTEQIFSRNLGRDALLFAAIVVILPNLFFLLASPFYIVERFLSPLLYLVAALLMIFLPRVIGWLAFALVAVLDLGFIVTVTFNLKVESMIKSVKYLPTIDPAASLLYLSVFIGIIATTILTAKLTSLHRDRFKQTSPLLAFCTTLLLMWLDWTFTLNHYFDNKMPFDSASNRAGISAETTASKQNNLLIVIVEGLGAYKNDNERKILENALLEQLPDGRFTYTSGTAPYFGSTTASEARELCGEKGSHLTYLEEGEFDCLPNKLTKNGYETISYHGFVEELFERNIWYPRIGFQESNFKKDIIRDTPQYVPNRCGSVFVALCDDEVADVVHARAIETADKPKMIYWLTVNTHIPYIAKENSFIGCGTKAAKIDNKTVCELTELWAADVFTKVSEIARDPNLPKTDILIIGDHHTPLWERSAKRKFIKDEVEWFLLKDSASQGSQKITKSASALN